MGTAGRIEILPDVAGVVTRSRALIVERLQTAIAERGIATIALSGGSTPQPLYEQLATENLPWEKIHLFWGDERYVPYDHPDSNYRMVKRAWIDRVGLPSENIHPMPTQFADPASAAIQHEADLRIFFTTYFADSPPTEWPALDVILLGMGDDAHTASLFPGTAALQVRDRWITVGEKSGQPRLTFTIPLINAARSVIFMLAGANKQAALQHVFALEADDFLYPSRFIQPQGELWWIMDQAAAQGLPETMA
ncbi:6-phosphogluconolactonase [Alkalinema sp. FACHB-956]|uniref:6-phosphogluconolactonase n=1 Tax=Alkalinema sp. FACHB-956 TaxID=2692768 RepID=UPI0016877617|nr:6-phosphogluconolactonase [Alkalinema sp. FACHB-956]MBD2326305.1 6-phosphogluconolactonase [Alkalinema sp. FACHB-956]